MLFVIAYLYVMTNIFNMKMVKERRRQLRNNMPESEAILWSKLNKRQLDGYRFLRQYSIGSYITDFYCSKLKLAIELDGTSHDRKENVLFDITRQNEIESYGVTFLRIRNVTVRNELNNVLKTIRKKINEIVTNRTLNNPPSPL